MKTEYINLQRDSEVPNYGQPTVLKIDGKGIIPNATTTIHHNDKITSLESLLSQKEQEIKEKDARIAELEGQMNEAVKSWVSENDSQISALQKENEAYRGAINDFLEMENTSAQVVIIQTYFKESLPYLNNPDK